MVIEIPAPTWTPPADWRGYRPQSNDVYRAATGIEKATVQINHAINLEAVSGIAFEPSVCVKAVSWLAGWSANLIELNDVNGCGFHCEIHHNGLGSQGVMANQASGCNFDGIYCHDNPWVGSDVGFNHAIYASGLVNSTGKGMRFERILNGGGLHFFGHAPHGNRFTEVTFDDCFVDIYAWGDGVVDNDVTKMLSLQSGTYRRRARTVEGGGAMLNSFSDFVTKPTPGYGYQGGVTPPPPPDVAALVAALEAEIHATSIGYTTWLDRKQNGYKGQPYAWQTTAWARADAILAKLKAAT